MKRGRRAAALAGLAAMSLGGCESVWSSIYRETNLDGGTTLITDAKQRAIINLPDYRHGRTGHRIVCAEPSPDVAQAMSVALQAGAAVTNGDTRVNANLALAMASSVAQLGERLAAIQLLRDKMYRACEAYANGATTQGGYISMLARVDKTMTTMLSTEMAAGAFGRNLAALGGSASTTPGADPSKVRAASDEVLKAAEDFQADRDAYLKEADKDKKAAAADKLVVSANNLQDKAAALARLEVQAGLNASGTATAGGKIDGTKGFDAGAITAIHRNYLDDDGAEGLVDACITELASSRYAYDDFLILAKKNHLYPTVEQRVQAGEYGGSKPAPVSITKEEFDRHFTAFMSARNQFTNYCMASVMGDNGRPSPFIAQRIAAKERLRAMAERSTLIQQCAPVLRAKAWSEGERALYSYCMVAMRS